MHPYLPHLLSDITAAHCLEIPNDTPGPAMTFEEEHRGIEIRIQLAHGMTTF